MTLWSPAHVGADGRPAPFYAYDKWKYRQEVVGFDCQPLRMERIGRSFLRLQINTGFYLPVTEHPDFRQYHNGLSSKLRRKLRGLDDFYREAKVQLVPARTAADFEDFAAIFNTQWPKDAWVNQLQPYLPKIYLRLEKLGRNRSLMLRDQHGVAIAGLLMYRTDHAVNWHLLSRRIGMLDKHAPGTYLVHRALQHFFDEGKETLLMFGPGDYEWKRRFLGRPYPVYRYEALDLRNLVGLAGLWKRLYEERYNAAAAAEPQD